MGAAVGTALAGAILMSALTTSFFDGIEGNPDVPDDLSAQAEVELSGGVPFIPDDQLEAALASAGVTGDTADAVVAENADARLAGLRAALAVLALVALGALFAARSIPTRQPGDQRRCPDSGAPPGRVVLGHPVVDHGRAEHEVLHGLPRPAHAAPQQAQREEHAERARRSALVSRGDRPRRSTIRRPISRQP